MKKLTKKQRRELECELRIEDQRRYADRIRVILLSDQGWMAEKIAEALFLDRSTIFRYRTSYESGGLEELIQDGYTGRRSSLREQDQAQLSEALSSTIFLSSKEVSAYILNHFGVKYTVSGTTALLKRMGYSYRKPDPKPAKSEAKTQQKFLRRLALIRAKMHKNDYLYFADACHPHMNSMPQYGWFKRGEKAFIPSTAKRCRVNLLGAVCIDSQETVMRSFKRISSHSVVQLIRCLEQKHSEARRINLVVDNASYFKSREVKIRLKKSNVRMIYLPTYSPNLNPIERLWKYLHKNLLYNKFHTDTNEFKTTLHQFCRGLRFKWGELETLLTYNCQLYTN